MVDPVTLLVPADEPYRGLALDLARKYLEIAGGSAGDGDALADAVAAALTQVAGQAAPGVEIAIAFAQKDGGVGVQVRCGRESTSVSQAVSVKR